MITISGKKYEIHCGIPAPSSRYRRFSEALDDRQRQEIELAKVYERDFHHGTTGHNQLMLIALLARLLEDVPVLLAEVQEDKG